MVLGDMPAALLPDFDLTKDEEGHLRLPPRAPWSIDRHSVCSSLSFFDAEGEPLYDSTQPVPIIWQDMLARQPYYRAVLRIVIAVRLSGYRSDTLALFVPDELDDARVLVGERERGELAALLPDLVKVMGYRALGKPSPARVGRILKHWSTVGAFELKGGRGFLQEPYARTLHERRRATRLLRGPAWEEQVRIEQFLKETS
jgi:hypothetical protein